MTVRIPMRDETMIEDKRPLYGFIPDPMPERVACMQFTGDVGHLPCLAIGLQPFSHNFRGDKVASHTVIMVEAGTNDNPRQIRIDLEPDSAKNFAKRLLEFAASAEDHNKRQIS